MQPRFLLLAALTLPLLLAATRQETYTLRLNVPAGTTYTQVNTSTTHQETVGAAQEFDSRINSTQSLTFDKAESETTITTKTTEFQAEGAAVMGKDPKKVSDEMKSLVETNVVNELGEVTKTATVGGGAFSKQGSLFSNLMQIGWNGVVFPKAPVSVGSKWTSKVDTKKISGAGNSQVKISSGEVAMTYELVGLEDVGGVKNFKVKLTVKGTMNGTMKAAEMDLDATINVSGDSTFWLDPVTGVHSKLVRQSVLDLDLGVTQIKVTVKSNVTTKKN